MSDIPLKFARRARETAKVARARNRLAATVRHDDEKGIEEGDTILMQTTSGEQFGKAEVVEVWELPIYSVIPRIKRKGLEYGIDDSLKLLEVLNSFYSDLIYSWSTVKVIVYRVTEMEAV